MALMGHLLSPSGHPPTASATAAAHPSTPGLSGANTSANPASLAALALVPPMHAALAAVPARAAHARTAEGAPKDRAWMELSAPARGGYAAFALLTVSL